MSKRAASSLLLLVSFACFLFSSVPASSSAATSKYNLSAFDHDEVAKLYGKSKFRTINRKVLRACDPNPSKYLQISLNTSGPLPNEAFVKVTVSGVLNPDEGDWVGMISPSDSSVDSCLIEAAAFYVETGDLAYLPLLCHYPVKAQFLSNDPGYLGCKNSSCQVETGNNCTVTTCTGSINFHVINIRTDIKFVLFSGSFNHSCVQGMSSTLKFANPAAPLYGHLSSTTTPTSMNLTWVSGDSGSQQVQYGNGKSTFSYVSTFTRDDMCGVLGLSPAKDFGWHDPGNIHSATMTGLLPNQTYSYRYGSNSVGWSDTLQFRTPPAPGSDKLFFLIYGDMGKATRDPSVIHYLNPGSISVATALVDELKSSKVDSIFHIGDISYATGYLVEWEFFLQLISPLATQVTYMTAMGNHERDYPGSESYYALTDSGGECGVVQEAYFQMPSAGKDKPWYSIEQGPVHFTVISTEHGWLPLISDQYAWMESDLKSINRTKTPWLIFTGHRPMYSSFVGFPPAADFIFYEAVEPLLYDYQVDLAFFGHVHNYERTCQVYRGKCYGNATNDGSDVDVYDSATYKAPVQINVGTGGFSLDVFSDDDGEPWSLVRISEYGYARVQATRDELLVQFVNAKTEQVDDQFKLSRKTMATEASSLCVESCIM